MIEAESVGEEGGVQIHSQGGKLLFTFLQRKHCLVYWLNL